MSQAGLNSILKMAIENMSEDNTTETDFSSRSVQDLQWLQQAIEAGAAGADVDVKEMLEALKNASAGNDIGDNLEYVAEFCEDLNFAEVAVNNRGIGICLQNLSSKDDDARRGAARLIATCSQNYPKIQTKTIHLLSLLLKLADQEKNNSTLKAQLSAISSISRSNCGTIAKFFELNGQSLIKNILSKDDIASPILNKIIFFTTRLIEESELKNMDFPDAVGLRRTEVIEKLNAVKLKLLLENVDAKDIESKENRDNLIGLL